MYHKIIPGLIALCVAVLLGIIGTILGQDYRWNGDLQPGRAFVSAGARFAEIPKSAIGLFQADNPVAPAAGITGVSAKASLELDSPTAYQLLPLSSEELMRGRQFMLTLINTDRVRFNLPPVALGGNLAAQRHADDMAQHNFRSHWGLDGLTPYMRYTRAGGVNRERENISGPELLTNLSDYDRQSLTALLSEVHREMMTRPEQRANIRDHWHRKVNLGIACNPAACWVAQQFAGDYARFDELPAITDGRLSFAGRLADGMELAGVAVWYHPPPRALTLGQLDATYSYSLGQYPATFLRSPPGPGRYYPDDQATYAWRNGIDPYTLNPELGRANIPPLPVDLAHTAAVSWTTAALWQVNGAAFRVTADLTPVLERAGPGVYTVQLWAGVGAERVDLTNYTIFVE